MTTTNLDLWPESLDISMKVTPPLVILREQASLLENKTKGLVKAEVRSNANANSLEAIARSALGAEATYPLSYSFFLVAPALGNYKYQLFRVIQPVDMYPLKIVGSPLEDIEIASEEDLLEKLKLIFASEKVKRVISAMIAQSQAA